MEADFESYGRRIGRIPLLDAREEAELARRAAGGDEEARRRMIEANLRLVVAVALRYRGRGVGLMDLVEEGNLGLIRAVEGFDPSRRCRFSTYAVWWILQSVRRSLALGGRGLRLPARVARWAARVRRRGEDLEKELGRRPAGAELDEALGREGLRPATRRLHRVDAARRVGSIDVHALEELPAPEDLAPLEAASEREQLERLRGLLAGLTARERQLLVLRYGLGDREPMSLQEIGKRLGMNRESVRVLERRLLARLARDLGRRPAGG